MTVPNPTIRPDTSWLADSFKTSHVIYVNDHMPPVKNIHINVDNQKIYSKNTIIDLFNESDIDYKNKTFIFDHYLLFDDFEKLVVNQHYQILLYNASTFVKYMQSWDITIQNDIFNNLTFMSNKTREHRVLCATVLANYFNPANLGYSFDNLGHKEIINSELLVDTDYQLRVDKTLPTKWFEHDALIELTNKDSTTGRSYKNNYEVFADCLYDQIYKNSATSIITEPNFYERGCMFTEKTLMSIYAGHFLIWPGGWKSAETAKRLGIDIFDDIIDHSYQYIEHPGRRVVEAITKNQYFLKNIELQTQLRNQNIDRFNSNLKLVRNLDLLADKIFSLN